MFFKAWPRHRREQIVGWAAGRGGSVHRLLQFVPARDFHVLITHLKVPVMMPIDPNSQKNSFSRDDMEQGRNSASLNVK